MRSVFLSQMSLILGLSLLSLSARAASTPTLYFGVYEVESGSLKSEHGSVPKAGGSAILAVDLDGLSALVCQNQQNCAALEPRLYVRFSGSESFLETEKLPAGYINGRGPQVVINKYERFPVTLSIPTGADRIETYITFSRYSFGTANCHLAYDMTECDIYNQSLQGTAYISNYGNNFQYPVAQN